MAQYDTFDDFIDDDDNISIAKLYARPRFPRGDLRHIPRKLREKFAQAALKKMREEAAENTQLLAALPSRNDAE